MREGETPRLRAAILAGLWTLVGLVSLASGILQYRAENLPVPWSRLLSDIAGWYLWLLFLPAAWWATRRFSLARESWRRALPLHVLFGLVAAALYAVLVAGKSQLVLNLGSGIWRWPSAAALRGYLFGGLPFYLLAYSVLVAVVHAFEYYRRYKEREVRASRLEAQLARSQLQVLKMQLDPHFLFNTLNDIAALVHIDPEGAERMIGQLGDFLRASLAHGDRQEVALEQELAFLDLYVGIERVRFGGRLRVEVRAEAGARQALVPSLILQPLVENAVRHGMRSEGIRVEVTARLVPAGLELRVADDGRGLPTGFVEAAQGIGLRNTRQRLRQLYGEEHQFVVSGGQDGGVSVRILLPFRGERSLDAAPGRWPASALAEGRSPG